MAQAPATPTIKTTSEEVVLDVVARDKKGKLVTDLKKEDLEVLDNGAKQSIQSFRRVEGRESINSSGQRTQLDPLRQVRLLTLVFERLGLNGRQLARQAALDLLKAELPQNVYVAVMQVDHRLSIVQPFTNDRETLKKSVTKVTGSETEFASDTNRIQQELQNQIGASGPSTGQGEAGQVAGMSDGAGSGPNGATNGGAAASKAMAEIMLNMLDFSRRNEEAQTGRASIFALLQLVREERRLPGRKTILYFSEGFKVPQGSEEAFKSVMSSANLSNVSFYSIDARGLNSNSLSGQGIDELASAAQAARTQLGGGRTTTAQARTFDNAIDGSRANTQVTLAILAENTGGALIANSNNFTPLIRKVVEEIESYYEISYSPRIQNYDGSYHKVSLQVTRPDVRVQSRDGYFAFPASLVAKNNSPVVAAYEMPLLTALNATPPPRDFTHSASGLHFVGPDKQTQCGVVIDVPLANIKISKDAKSGRFKGAFSYVALVKDQSGAIVKKFAGEQTLDYPADKVTAVQASHFIYTEHADLMPGRYRLETAVRDASTEKTSTRKASFLTPDSADRVALSSVVMVRSLRDSGVADPANPFVYNGKSVTPALDGTVKKSEVQGVPFYLVIYANSKIAEQPKLTMTFHKDGQTLGSGTPDLGLPDANGRIQYVATVPVTQLETGNYDVQFAVKQGAESASETVSFTIEQ